MPRVRRLIVNPGTENTWEIPLQNGFATLGREADNDFVIEHPSLSKHHCEFVIMDSGVTVKDLDSANGTFIDGQAVSESVLLPGQMLQLGEVRLQLEPTTVPAIRVIAAADALSQLHPRHAARADTSELSFPRQILGAFKYPLKGDGLILIAVGTFLFLILDAAKAVARFAPIYGLIAMIILTVASIGYLTAYLRLNLNATALGEDDMPVWPEMKNLGATFFELLVTVLFSFAPAIGLTIYAAVAAGAGDTAWLGWVTMAALLLGSFYFPMAFMAVSMFDSAGAVNPLLVIPAIAKVLKEYLLTVVMLLVILVLRWLLKNYLPALLPVPLLPLIIFSLAELYLLIVEVRMLGLLYRHKKRELAWFP
jgi:hypothetical protein